MGFLSSILRPQPVHVASIEDGYPQADPNVSGNLPGSRGLDDSTTIAENEKLNTFRLMSGIASTRSLNPPGSIQALSRAAPNIGIYGRVIHRESIAKRNFRFTSLLINGCLGLQIVVAAALTALGAANSDHKAVTAFGAINTVIAGLLTYMKGSGVPNRFKYYHNEWRKVREYIEQREREFSRPGSTQDVYQVIAIIEAMYEEVRADIETNTPDSYVSVGDLRNRASPTNPAPRLANRIQSPFVPQYNDRIKDLESRYGDKIRSFASELERNVKDHDMSGLGSRIMSFASDFEHKAKEKEEDLEGELARGLDNTRGRFHDVEGEVKSHHAEMAQAQRDIEEYAKSRLNSIASKPGITISIGPTSSMSPTSPGT